MNSTRFKLWLCRRAEGALLWLLVRLQRIEDPAVGDVRVTIVNYPRALPEEQLLRQAHAALRPASAEVARA